MIGRRTVILAVVGGLLAAPFASHVHPADGAPPAALQQALADLGYVDGKNVTYVGRWAETKFERLETAVANYRATIVMLEAGPQPEKQDVAIAPPSIQIIDPPTVITRDTATIKVRTGLGVRTVVGRVTAPEGLLSLTANDVPQDVDADGYFKTRVELTGGKTRVTMVAVDRQGKRAQLELFLQEDATIGKAPVVVPSRTPGQSPRLGKYYALVIGNQKYQKLARLDTPEADATDIAALLKDRYGFTVTVLLNATRWEMLEELNKMRVLLTEKDNLLIYYAGHGQLDRVNFTCNWLPVDADPASFANWISSSTLTESLNMMSAKHILMVADSCYLGVMTHSSIGQLQAGLSDEARLVWLQSIADSPSRTVLTSGGVSPVLDGGGGKHSVFAQNFIDVLSENQDILPGKQLADVLSARVLDVARRMKFQQRPEYGPIRFAGGESGDFIFAPSLNTSQERRPILPPFLGHLPRPPPSTRFVMPGSRKASTQGWQM